VSMYSERLQEVHDTAELWAVIRAWDTYNKERRKKKVRK
jgi:hypothetical protein